MPIPGAPALRQASPEARTAGGVFCGAVKDMAGRDRIPLISSPPPPDALHGIREGVAGGARVKS